MITDGQTLLLFAVKVGFTTAALLAIGLGLHAGLGVTTLKKGRPEFTLMLSASSLTLVLMLARLTLLNAQLGGSLSAAFDFSLFAWTWAALGSATLATVAGCLAAGAAAVLGNRWLAAASAVLLAAGFALTGHAAAAEPAELAPAAAGFHVLIAGFWIAAPASLYPARALAGEDLHDRLRQYSRYATVLVPLMLALGLWLAWTLAGGIEPLFTTLYGGLLLAKLAAASIALGLGAFNQRIVTRLVQSDPVRGGRWLKLTLLVDAGLFAVAIVAISAATTLTGPPSQA